MLEQAGVVDARHVPRERTPKRVLSRSCCRAAFLRGALLAAGSVSPPPSPHLEIRSESRSGAEAIAAAAATEGAELRVVERGDHALAYAKGIDRIAGVLATAGANDAALVLQERAVLGATKARANRLANADHANLVRAGRAAHVQLEAVRRLERARRLDELAPPLREIAQLRLKHPSLSLRELGAKCSPAASKATAHRRLGAVVESFGASASRAPAKASLAMPTMRGRAGFARAPVSARPARPRKWAGRRGSSEDDLPLRIVALRTLATDGV